MQKVPTERKWIRCPFCGAKHSIYDDTSECFGVYLKCYRGCKREFELLIHNGEQQLRDENGNVCVTSTGRSPRTK